MAELGCSKYKNMNGVTCYMNSILAILQQSPLFPDYIVSGKFKEYLNTEDYSDLIIFQLHKLFQISLSKNNSNITPTSLRKVCAKKDFIWGENQQQDSAEFLQFLITKIQEEIAQNVKFIPGSKMIELKSIEQSFEVIQAISRYQNFVKKEFSPINKMFTGLEKVSTCCQICGCNGNNFETFSIWQLPIPISKDVSLKDCMDKWMETEKLDDENRLTCGFCGVKSNAKKSNTIFMSPKILIIQLKRFKKDAFGNFCSKINSHVNFPINNLNISDYMSESSVSKDKSIYNLFGVNMHHELGGIANINLGHYVSIVKNRFDNNWYLFNDNDEPIKIKNKNNIINKKAYLLFYYRVN